MALSLLADTLALACHVKSGPSLFSSPLQIFGPPDNLFQIC